jgi:hypothetical protein
MAWPDAVVAQFCLHNFLFCLESITRLKVQYTVQHFMHTQLKERLDWWDG